jgi:hypothetical protein
MLFAPKDVAPTLRNQSRTQQHKPFRNLKAQQVMEGQGRTAVPFSPAAYNKENINPNAFKYLKDDDYDGCVPCHFCRCKHQLTLMYSLHEQEPKIIKEIYSKVRTASKRGRIASIN